MLQPSFDITDLTIGLDQPPMLDSEPGSAPAPLSNYWYFTATTPDGQIIGGLELFKHGRKYVIDPIHVEEIWRRNGIATALLQAAECHVGRKIPASNALSKDGALWRQAIGY